MAPVTSLTILVNVPLAPNFPPPTFLFRYLHHRFRNPPCSFAQIPRCTLIFIPIRFFCSPFLKISFSFFPFLRRHRSFFLVTFILFSLDLPSFPPNNHQNDPITLRLLSTPASTRLSSAFHATFFLSPPTRSSFPFLLSPLLTSSFSFSP